MLRKVYSVLVIIMCLASGTTVHAGVSYNDIGKMASHSPQSLLDEGARLFREGDDKGAMLRFKLINSRMQSDLDVYAQSLHYTGLIYYAEGVYAKAMDCYMNSLDVCEEVHNDSLRAMLYKDVGNIYSMYGDYSTSSKLYRQALPIARKQGNRTLTNMLLNNLIFAYTPKTPLKQYEEWYHEMEQNRDDRPRYPYDLLMVRGTLDSYAHNYHSSLAKFKQALSYSRSHKLPPLCEAMAVQSIAESYQQMGRTSEAIACQMKNLDMANRLGIRTLRVNSLKALSELYEPTDRQKALAYKSDYLLLNDSILNENGLNEIRNTFFYHEMDRKVATINSQTRLIVGLAVFSFVLIVLLTVIFLLNRKLKRAYKTLFDQIQQNMAHDAILSKQLSTINRQQNKQTEAKPTEKPVTEVEKMEMTAADESSDEEHSDRRKQLDAIQQSRLLTAILDVMENTESFCAFDFSIDTLASLVQSNSRYVSQTINDVYGQNFRSFLNEFRIKKAMTRMNDYQQYGNYTIKAIAESVGYKSQANFINVFTKVTGMKPSTYIKQLREKKAV